MATVESRDPGGTPGYNLPRGQSYKRLPKGRKTAAARQIFKQEKETVARMRKAEEQLKASETE